MAMAALGCEAEVESSCVGGDCRPYQSPQVPNTYEAPLDCTAGCDTMSVSGNTGEYPCEVETIITDVCVQCHTPGGQGPFTLEAYEDSQQLYGPEAIWFRMVGAIESDFMPLIPEKLTPDEKRSLLDEWACVCAPPREAGETCE
jgi:hypothetical protein